MKTSKKENTANNDPFDGVLAQRAREGKLKRCYYKSNGLPKLRTKSAPGWMPLAPPKRAK